MKNRSLLVCFLCSLVALTGCSVSAADNIDPSKLTKNVEKAENTVDESQLISMETPTPEEVSPAPVPLPSQIPASETPDQESIEESVEIIYPLIPDLPELWEPSTFTPTPPPPIEEEPQELPPTSLEE